MAGDELPIREPLRRAWQPRETLLVSQYVARTFPDATRVRTRVRLGSTPIEPGEIALTPEDAGALRVWTRWADAVVEYRDRVIIIEAKIVPKVGPLEALLEYRALAPQTPDLELRGRRVELLFLYAVEDPVLVQIARDLGIRATQFAPPWVAEYLGILSGRERRPPIQRIPLLSTRRA